VKKYCTPPKQLDDEEAGAFVGNPVPALGQLAPNVPPYSKLG
jgi:hypothetical protein